MPDIPDKLPTINSSPETISVNTAKSNFSGSEKSVNSWGSSYSPDFKSKVPGDGSVLRNQHGGDRITQQWHGPSLKGYPPDCHPPCPRWFYATDVPKRKPKLLNTNTNTKSELKPTQAPKKFVAFSEHDSRSIEAAYQQLIHESNNLRKETPCLSTDKSPSLPNEKKTNNILNQAIQHDNFGGKFRVPVQEDYLFDVDVEKREISPVYWLGPVFEVRRGSWFYQEGTTLRPCEENLAAQLEEGYLKVKPFRYPKPSDISSRNSKSLSVKLGDTPGSPSQHDSSNQNRNEFSELIPPGSSDDQKTNKHDMDEKTSLLSIDLPGSTAHQPQTYRLFGTYMNTVITYQDSCVAWLSADSIMSRVSSTVYQRFAGGGYLGGVKLVRGYTDINKTKEYSETKGLSVPSSTTPRSNGTKGYFSPQIDQEQQKLLKEQSMLSENPGAVDGASHNLHYKADISLSNNKISGSEIEACSSHESNDHRNEFNDRESELQGRQIDHLILCTHGIGQRLGMRTESVNFVHDINVLRQTLKSVYASSTDLQALNCEIDKLPKNCRIQVLPICWRHLLDFPQKAVRQTRKEHDLGDAFGDEEEYPSLEDITIEGVPFVRSLITDLALDILLFQSAYREHICNIVLAESNRIYNLFKERNPEFKGKVSLLGHSLGSAILFDLLSRQKEHLDLDPCIKSQKKYPVSSNKNQLKNLELQFEVEDLYCYGSPIGLFQMLKGRNIMARQSKLDMVTGESKDSENLQDPFLATSQTLKLPSSKNNSNDTGLPPTVSSPKVGRLYNIFHPSDPIAYRLEPLISPAMSSMKPQSLPYTKKTISSSMSGIGAKVGQSVSGIWTSFSSGLASSLFNRSLGLTNDDIARMESSNSSKQSFQQTGNNKLASSLADTSSPKREDSSAKKKQLAENISNSTQEGTGGMNSTASTDENIETLYSGFQKTRKADQGLAEEKWKRMKREEAKVRALNSNGRVDYSLQENFLDLNPMNTIASHMSYWADEDNPPIAKRCKSHAPKFRCIKCRLRLTDMHGVMDLGPQKYNAIM